MRLGVNIDHVATLRQQRKEGDPDLVKAALTVIQAGADGITIHLREDRRHIQDDDVFAIRQLDTRLNLEMAATEEMVGIAKTVKPHAVCLVPEKREELTTEGGLNVVGYRDYMKHVISQLKSEGSRVSLFLDPDETQIRCAHEIGADCVEIHTGAYAQSTNPDLELLAIANSIQFGHQLGLEMHAGHGLSVSNIKPVLRIPNIQEVNIGHSIVSHALFVGLAQAVREIKALIDLSE